MALGEGHRHLHRPAGAHRVQAGQQAPAAQRQPRDHLLEQCAQLALGAQGLQPLCPAAAIRRAQGKRGIHRERGHVARRRAALDLGQGDAAEAGHRRIGAVGGFLLDHRQCRAQVGIAGLDLERGEGRLHIARPAFAVVQGRRQLAQQRGVDLVRGARPCAVAGRQRREQAAESEHGGQASAEAWGVRHGRGLQGDAQASRAG